MNNLGLRCSVFGMDARREAKRMVIPFARFATQQTPEYTATLRAESVLGTYLRCKPLVVNAQLRVLRLGLRPKQTQRKPRLFIYEPLTPRMTNQSEPQGVYYAADLPLSWAALNHLSPAQTEQWQHDAVALLRTLAVFETPVAEADRDLASAAGKSMERLEAKLDLALNMIMQLARQQTELPTPHPVILRADTVEWSDAAAPQAGQSILISLHLSPRLPQPLLVPATVTMLQSMENGTRVQAKFTHLNQEMEEWLERTLFRFHRRSIQQSHSLQHDES